MRQKSLVFPLAAGNSKRRNRLLTLSRCSGICDKAKRHMTALRFDGITKRYGVRTVLDDVSLRVGSRGIVALAGVNGSGKSTLYRIAAGFVRQEAGRVLLERAAEKIDQPQ